MNRTDWLIRHKWLTGVGTVFVAGTIALLIYQPSWTGFGPDSTKNTERDSTGKVIKTVEVEQSGKTLWDWLSVLGVPFSLAVLGFWFQQREQKRVEERAKLEKQIAEANQREEALQAYFDRLSTLLVDQNLIAIAAKVKRADETTEQPNPVIEEQRELLDAAVDVIRARTLSTLRQLGEDGERKGSVIRFLSEAEVMGKLNLSLSDADLSGANLSFVHLNGADLRRTNLSDADLYRADLHRSNFNSANFYGSNLIESNLHRTGLHRANLSSANFNGANLSYADLKYANFNSANLKYANLSEAKGWTDEQLSAAKLCRTKLPEGCKLDPDRDCEELMGSKSQIQSG